MASLKNHGKEIGRIESLISTNAYMGDGKILRNVGFGWKLYAIVPDGVTPEQHFRAMQNKARTLTESRPCYIAYKKALHKMAGLSKRWKLHEAVKIMYDDPDGVWSETCDGYGDNVSASIEEVVNLCKLYQAMQAEKKELVHGEG